jgi:hypothetical protein
VCKDVRPCASARLLQIAHVICLCEKENTQGGGNGSHATWYGGRTDDEERAAEAAGKWAKRMAAIEAMRARVRDNAEGITTPGPLSHLPTGMRVVAFDAGRTSIRHGVEVLAGGSVREYNLSGRQYRSDSGMRDARLRISHPRLRMRVWEARVGQEKR